MGVRELRNEIFEVVSQGVLRGEVRINSAALQVLERVVFSIIELQEDLHERGEALGKLERGQEGTS